MPSTDVDHDFEALLVYLKLNRGFDFTGYKRSSLMRRVEKRMQAVGITTYPDYVDYLEVHPEEFGELFNTILINVTSFFRDPAVWETLKSEIIPRIVSGKQTGEPIRVWSVGCASGEEAYTLAIVLAEALGMDRFRESVKIYATDVDEEALNKARHGSYTTRDVRDIPQVLLDKYFERTEGLYVFRRDLRRSVIFGRHDVLQDAPISRIDLLVCRNTLMYFNAETQARVLNRFEFALVEGGFLVLGRAEMLFTQTNAFVPVDLKRRIFSKGTGAGPRDRVVTTNMAREDLAPLLADPTRIRQVVFDTGPVAQIAVDANGSLALANERARMLFDLRPNDIGRPLRDLQLSYRPVELRSLIEQAYAERRMLDVKDVEWHGFGGSRWLEVQVMPLVETNGALLGAAVAFSDVTRYRQLQEEVERSRQELETAYEELQSTNEELETTNEELQSTVEELETTNEELQSTNEELETMNEELQSTNEELQTINEELRCRSEDLNEANALMESILTSLQRGVIVVDRDVHVMIWNRMAEDLWGLRADEVRDHNLFNLDIGLPVDQLHQPIRSCLIGETPSAQLRLSATDRRGRQITCDVRITPLIGADRQVRGAILLIEERGDDGYGRVNPAAGVW
jgi:two-component system CheB/CheR fusion protein